MVIALTAVLSFSFVPQFQARNKSHLDFTKVASKFRLLLVDARWVNQDTIGTFYVVSFTVGKVFT